MIERATKVTLRFARRPLVGLVLLSVFGSACSGSLTGNGDASATGSAGAKGGGGGDAGATAGAGGNAGAGGRATGGTSGQGGDGAAGAGGAAGGTPCGSGQSCAPGRICVSPTCGGGPAVCTPLPDGGQCPSGWTYTALCASGVGPACLLPPCTPAAPFCADLPSSCGGTPTCSCLPTNVCEGNGECQFVSGFQVLCGAL
jgi:hypothetical protein